MSALRQAQGERRRHLKAVVGVSPEAKALIEAAFEEGKATYPEIAAAILERTGEKIGRSSIQRYWRFWNVERRAKEAAEIATEKLEALRTVPRETLLELIEHQLTVGAYEGLAQAAAGSLDPGKLIRALAARDRGKLAKQQLALDERRVVVTEQALELERQKVAIAERRLQALESRLREAGAKVGDLVAAKEISPEVAGKIREIYGLSAEAAPSA